MHHYSPPSRDLERPHYEQMKESGYTNGHSNSKTDMTIINMFGDMLKSGKFDTSMAEEQFRHGKSAETAERILESKEKSEQGN
jgi:hypothetical protein